MKSSENLETSKLVSDIEKSLLHENEIIEYKELYEKFREAEKYAQSNELNIWGDPALAQKYLRSKSKWGQNRPRTLDYTRSRSRCLRDTISPTLRPACKPNSTMNQFLTCV